MERASHGLRSILLVQTAVLVVASLGAWLWYSRVEDDELELPHSPIKGAKKIRRGSKGFIGQMRKQECDVIVFYGSQSGTALEFANRLAKEATRFGMKGMVVDPEECDPYELKLLASVPNHLAIFCLATYGEGEPAENFTEFHRKLRELPDFFTGLNYAVFGLGDETYEHFNAIGRFVDDRLKERGATQIHTLGLGDDSWNIEEDFITWKDGLWTSVCRRFDLSELMEECNMREYELIEHEATSVPDDKIFKGEISEVNRLEKNQPPFNRSNPFPAKLVKKTELSRGEKSCLHLEFDIKESWMPYRTGDHLAVYPSNDPKIVTRIGELLDTDLDQIITLKHKDADGFKEDRFPCPTSYRTALTHYVDICGAPRTHVLREISKFCHNFGERRKLELMSSGSDERKDEYDRWIWGGNRSILHVLEDLPSCKPPLHLLLEFLPRLQPRFYSISSSPKIHPGYVHIIAAEVAYQTPTRRAVRGVATSLLAKTDCGEKLPILVWPSRFQLPEYLKTPMILIGPGTGVAPFRAFLQDRGYHRRRGRYVGHCHLFFGCRRRDEDFLYREELEAFAAKGICTLYTAFSREQAEKIYVTDVLAEHKDLIWDILDKWGGSIYVCGVTATIVPNVRKIVSETLQEKGNMTSDEADDFIDRLQVDRRYCTDMWRA